MHDDKHRYKAQTLKLTNMLEKTLFQLGSIKKQHQRTVGELNEAQRSRQQMIQILRKQVAHEIKQKQALRVQNQQLLLRLQTESRQENLLDSSIEEISKLHQEIERLKIQKDDLIMKVEYESTVEYNKLRNEFNTAQERLLLMEGKLQEFQRNQSKLKAEKKNLQLQLHKQPNTLSHSRSTQELRQNRIFQVQYKQQLQKLKQQNLFLKEVKKDLEQSVAEYESIIGEYRTSLDESRMKYDSRQLQYLRERNQQRTEKETLRVEIDRLKDQMLNKSEINQSLEIKNTKISQLQLQVTHLEEQNMKITQRTQTLLNRERVDFARNLDMARNQYEKSLNEKQLVLEEYKKEYQKAAQASIKNQEQIRKLKAEKCQFQRLKNAQISAWQSRFNELEARFLENEEKLRTYNELENRLAQHQAKVRENREIAQKKLQSKQREIQELERQLLQGKQTIKSLMQKDKQQELKQELKEVYRQMTELELKLQDEKEFLQRKALENQQSFLKFRCLYEQSDQKYKNSLNQIDKLRHESRKHLQEYIKCKTFNQQLAETVQELESKILQLTVQSKNQHQILQELQKIKQDSQLAQQQLQQQLTIIHSKDRTITQLKLELDLYKQRNQTIVREKELFREQIEEKQQIISQLEQKLDKFEKSLLSLKQSYDDQERSNKLSENKLHDEIQTLKSDNIRMGIVIEQLKDVKEQLIRYEEREPIVKINYQKQIAQLKTENEKKQQIIEENNVMSTKKEEKWQETLLIQQDMHRQEKIQMDEAHQMLRENIDILNRELQRITKQSQNKERALRENEMLKKMEKEENQDRTSEIVELAMWKNRLASENMQLAMENERLKLVNDQLLGGIEEMRKKNQGLSEDYHKLQKQIHKFQTDNHNMQAQKHKLSTQNLKLSIQLQKLTSQSNNLLRQNLKLTQQTSEIPLLKAQLQKQASERQSLQYKLQQSNKKLKNSEFACMESNQQIQRLKTQLSLFEQTKAQLSKIRQQSYILQNQLIKQQQELKQLQQQISRKDRMLSKAQQIKGNKQQLEQRYKQLEQEIEELTKNNQKYVKTIENMKSYIEQTKNELQTTTQQLHAALQKQRQLQLQLESTTHQLQLKQANIRQRQLEFSSLNQQLHELQSIIRSKQCLVRQYETKQIQQHSLHSDLQQKFNKMQQDYKVELQNKDETISRIIFEREQYIRENQNNKNNVENTKCNVDRIRQQLQSRVKHEQKINEQRRELKEQLFYLRREVDNLRDDLAFQRKRNNHMEDLYNKYRSVKHISSESFIEFTRGLTKVNESILSKTEE